MKSGAGGCSGIEGIARATVLFDEGTFVTVVEDDEPVCDSSSRSEEIRSSGRLAGVEARLACGWVPVGKYIRIMFSYVAIASCGTQKTINLIRSRFMGICKRSATVMQAVCALICSGN